MKTSITLPPVEDITITEIVLRASEIGITATAKAGTAVFATAGIIVRDGDTEGCLANPAPTTIQGALTSSGRRTPTGRTDLLKAISSAIASGGDVFAAAEECGKAAGWFLG